MTADGPRFALDHVVLLLPYDMLQNPPAWITDQLTVSPGGQHADGKTENRLVLFQDGTYLELIAFVKDDPEKRSGHWWDKPYGVVDFAFTTTDLDYESLKQRFRDSGTGISYAEPKAGGRITPDGKELKWEVTFPTGVDRGNVPFFCTDVTPRERRVPVNEANATHPSGAIGMAGMHLEVEKRDLERLSKATAAVLGVKKQDNDQFDVNVPKEVKKSKQASIRIQEVSKDSKKDLALTLRLQTANHNPRDAVRQQIGDGLVSISFE
ncbi:hypothetical protein LTR37_008717 [Vermiconidia calcicola]|uniref:Uncharacterized protein n=1 Tax=Vermiconidia calcicola TaxID=1690605 RepID=A0ACC3NA50_9PEZI|nr:hypothetical protein LTR37_008717 [Vermiconidia calcicola]